MGAARLAVVLPPRECFSPDAAGAIGLLVHRLARQPSESFQTVVLGQPTEVPFADVPFHPVRPIWGSLTPAGRYAAGVARVVRALRPALVEVHNRPELALSLTRLGVPVGLVLHNDPQGMRRFRAAPQRARAAERLAGIATVSAWLHERLGVARAAVLPNCIDFAELPASVPERERLILFAGRIVADKGADAFVAACARALPRLPGWRAEMIGADRFGADSPETPFLRALRPQARAGGVRLAGWQPHRAVLEAMARAAIVVVPSRWLEPFGMTALEAAACGAAVLYAPRGGLPEVMGEAGIAIDPDDAEGMGDTLIRLAGDPARLAVLGRAARERAGAFGVAQAVVRLEAWRCAMLRAWPVRHRGPISSAA